MFGIRTIRHVGSIGLRRTALSHQILFYGTRKSKPLTVPGLERRKALPDLKFPVERVKHVLEPYCSQERINKINQVLKNRCNVAVCFENLGEASNIAAILRTADGLGLQEVHTVMSNKPYQVPQGAAAGADRWLTIRHHDNIQQCLQTLRDKKYVIIATDLGNGAINMEDEAFPATVRRMLGSGDDELKLAVFFGNEARGISKYLAAHADMRFFLPMKGFAQSFNVSVSAAVTLTILRNHGFLSKPLDPKDHDTLYASSLIRSVSNSLSLLRQEGVEVDEYHAPDPAYDRD